MITMLRHDKFCCFHSTISTDGCIANEVGQFGVGLEGQCIVNGGASASDSPADFVHIAVRNLDDWFPFCFHLLFLFVNYSRFIAKFCYYSRIIRRNMHTNGDKCVSLHPRLIADASVTSSLCKYTSILELFQYNTRINNVL